jgi:anthranilate phosphoribosyltransferase
MVVLNSAAAFVVAGFEEDFEKAIQRAEDGIDSGRAKEKLNGLVEFTQRCETSG